LGHLFNLKWSNEVEVIAVIRVHVEIDSVTLDYRYGYGEDDWQNLHYTVRIVWTPCNFGGRRPWFRCPAKSCEKRVAILYGDGIFACRRCYLLAYPSQRESAGNRAARRADKIRDRLAWEPGILNGGGLKPKGMHWKTFRRLSRLHDHFVELFLTEAALRFGITF
jgi:hypothetical protein